jgi:3-phosphoshikimate 1-carboxyvinyltransferase
MASSTYSAPTATPWLAPTATAPLAARLHVPGSKSLTNRELVLSALADGPSVLRGGLVARDTRLMMEALRALGTVIDEREPGVWRVDPRPIRGGVDLHAGLAGTVMRFVPPVAALADGAVRIDGDEQARARPMATTIASLRALGVTVDDEGDDRLPFTIRGHGMVEGGELEIDASASSQFVSGLLLAAPRFRDGLVLRHVGDRVPSMPHIDMTVATLRRRGVQVETPEPTTWVVRPGAIAGIDLAIEPDLSNAAPFLAAAVVVGGTVTIADWPAETTQVGADLVDLLGRFGATFRHTADGLTIDGGDGIAARGGTSSVGLWLGNAGELAPTIAGLCAFTRTRSRILGIGHLRGHETDRLEAIVADLAAVGARAEIHDDGDGIEFYASELHGGPWRSFADHRMATTGALVGLAVPGVEVDDIATTAKTLPEFVELWTRMLA